MFSHEFTGGGFDSGSELRAVALAPGGTIDLAGVSDERDEREVLAVRLTEHGPLDPSFGSGGALITTFLEPTYGQITLQWGEAELVQADGSIVMGGPGIVGRLTPSGQLDPSFQHDGNRIGIYAIASLPSGNLLTAGEERSEPNTRSPAAVERLLPDGARDPSFGHEGQVNLPLPAGEKERERARAAIALPEGKLLLAGTGSYWSSPSTIEEFIWLTRLNPNGSLDDSFGTGGIDYLPATGGDVALARQPSGRLVLLGETRTESPGPWGEAHGWQTAAWGFTEQGAPDTSFGDGGVTLLPSTEPGLSNFVAAATVDSQGRVLVASNQVKQNSYRAAAFVARLTTTGRLDTSYGRGGLAVGVEGSTFNAVTVDSSGRAIAAGGGPGGTLVERFQGDSVGLDSPQPASQQPGAGQSATNVPPQAPAVAVATFRQGAGSALARLRLRCVLEKHPAAPHVRAPEVKCSLTIDHVSGSWSSLEMVLRLGRVSVSHRETHDLQMPAHFSFQVSLPSRRTTYALTVILSRGQHCARLATKLVLPG